MRQKILMAVTLC